MNVLDGASGFWEVPKTPPPVSHPVPPILLPHWLLRSIFSLSLPSLIISLLDYCLAVLLEVTGPPPAAFPCLQKNVQTPLHGLQGSECPGHTTSLASSPGVPHLELHAVVISDCRWLPIGSILVHAFGPLLCLQWLQHVFPLPSPRRVRLSFTPLYWNYLVTHFSLSN